MRRLAAAVTLVFIIIGATNFATAAEPGPRVALVIGNSAYADAPLAEVAVSRDLFRKIMSLIGDLRPRPATAR